MSRIISAKSRSRLFASAAVLSLLAASAVGEHALTHPASATAKASDLHGQTVQG